MSDPQRSPYQADDGFPSDDYFDDVEIALERLGVTIVDSFRSEPWEWAAHLDPRSFGDEGQYAGEDELWLCWRADEMDEPQHAEDFTNEGWYWMVADEGQSGKWINQFTFGHLEDPEAVAAEVAELLRPSASGKAPA